MRGNHPETKCPSCFDWGLGYLSIHGKDKGVESALSPFLPLDQAGAGPGRAHSVRFLEISCGILRGSFDAQICHLSNLQNLGNVSSVLGGWCESWLRLADPPVWVFLSAERPEQWVSSSATLY